MAESPASFSWIFCLFKQSIQCLQINVISTSSAVLPEIMKFCVGTAKSQLHQPNSVKAEQVVSLGK